ncbi:MAG: insulinase family protein [Opitutaceae bacterium]|nr:insulinase family protein [Opitutaceae bacterium]
MVLSSLLPHRPAAWFIAVFTLVAATADLGARTPELTGPRSGKWAHEGAKLAPDERVLWGRLDNGFRYALLPHQGVPGRVTLQLIVLAGSLDERPDELGIAHYIEHLAFGGSKNFKAEDMIALFQRLGVEYGSDVNANTTFDATTYKLDFRENTPALLQEGLRLFRDFGDGVTFEPAVIEQERRVVLAELRNRNTLAGRQQQASMPVVFRGLHFPQRMPGGSDALIARFTRDQFLNFYRRCYRPDVMVLVGAGDFDVAAMTAQVREIFGSMVRPATPIPPRDEGKLDARGLRAGVFRIGGVSSAATETASVMPLPPRLDTREILVDRQRREFVMNAFAERLRTEIPRAAGAEASYEELLGYGVAMASVGVPADEWQNGVGSLDEMVRLTLERGLDASDVETLRRRNLRLATHMLDQLPTLDPGSMADALVESITAHVVYIGYARRFTWMREWLERFTPADAQGVFRGMWNLNTTAFHVAGGVDIQLNGDKVVQEVQKRRRAGLSHVLARQHRVTPFRMPRWGQPTTVADRRELPALGAKLMRFGNNARLNFVSSRQEAGLVRVVVRVGAGLLEMPGNKPALKEFGLNTLLASGAVHFPPEQLNGLIDDKFLEFSFDIADRDAFTFRGTMAVEQLEPFLAIVTDILHAPKFNSYVHRETRLRAAMSRAADTVGMQDGMRELTDYLFKGDARFTWGSPLDYMSMSVVDVKRWMEESLSRGYLEATIVGDIAEEAAVGAVSRTLGALRPRLAEKKLPAEPKPVVVTAPAGFKRIEFVGEQNVGLVVGTWPVTELLHIRDQAALELLAKLLEIRIRGEVREKLGLAYSPSASFQAYDGFPTFSILQAQIDSSPNDTMKVAPLVERIAAEVAQKGVKEGEFIGARGILKGQLRQAFRENGFLIGMLMRAQERPEEIEEIVALHGGLMETVTRDDVNKWAAKILPATNCRTAAIVPKAFVGIFDVGKP